MRHFVWLVIFSHEDRIGGHPVLGFDLDMAKLELLASLRLSSMWMKANDSECAARRTVSARYP
jgi:hypothetical protein